MNKYQINTAVAFFIFNREDVTQKVFNEIARAKPPKLLVVGDGPRAHIQGDLERVTNTRSIIDKVDWSCEVITNFSDQNMGCRDRVSSGLDWVFNQVDEAIILEDDCLPNPSFFQFCEELLIKYRNNDAIGMISGDNFQFGEMRGNESYYFSEYFHIWGWASWSRAWKDYDVQMVDWPEFRNKGWKPSLNLSHQQWIGWKKNLEGTYSRNINTWDHQWTFANWRKNKLCILPMVNLISNLGFGPEATHTRGSSIFANIESREIGFPLSHPESIRPNEAADLFTTKIMFSSSPSKRFLSHIKSLVKRGFNAMQNM